MGVPLAPSKTPTVKQQQQAAAARKAQGPAAAPLHSQHSIDEALHDLDELHLAPIAANDAGGSIRGNNNSSSGNGLAAEAVKKSKGAGGAAAGRPLGEYCMEADLAR